MRIPHFIASLRAGDKYLSLFQVGNYHYQICNVAECEVEFDMPETDFETACALFNDCGNVVATCFDRGN